MPMVETNLAEEIVDAMAAQGFIPTEGNRKLAAAIAKAVIAHIIANAEVTGGVCAPGGHISGGKVL